MKLYDCCHRDFRLAALQELRLLLDIAYRQYASKRVQAMMFEDVLAAVQLTDR